MLPGTSLFISQLIRIERHGGCTHYAHYRHLQTKNSTVNPEPTKRGYHANQPKVSGKPGREACADELPKLAVSLGGYPHSGYGSYPWKASRLLRKHAKKSLMTCDRLSLDPDLTIRLGNVGGTVLILGQRRNHSWIQIYVSQYGRRQTRCQTGGSQNHTVVGMLLSQSMSASEHPQRSQ
jgi:hypothetical protein